MEKFKVIGMSCVACSNKVEKAVSKVKGVTYCSVSLLTNELVCDGEFKNDDIINAVYKAGYDAKLNNADSNIGSSSIIKDDNILKLVKRLILSLFFLLIFVYISMGHLMFNFPLPDFFVNNYLAIAIIEMILSLIIMSINKAFFINGFKSLLNFSPNMDTLVAMGASISFIWSFYCLMLMTKSIYDGDYITTKQLCLNLYFESSAMIVTFITIGKVLEAKSKGKTTDAINSLIKLRPEIVTIMENGVEKQIPISSVKVNDILVIKPGDYIPVDGIITFGNTVVDESTITGESIPIDKNNGDLLKSGTINIQSVVNIKAVNVGEDTTIAKIIKLVSDAQNTKAPITKIADKISYIFVPTIMVISFITIIIWFFITKDIAFSLERGISVLVISCPCALGLATPVAIMVGSGVGAKNGILYKTADAIEEVSRCNCICIDKTGTITKGVPIVTDIVKYNNDMLDVAYNVEKNSKHPLAKAVVDYCESNNFINNMVVNDFKSMQGFGVSCDINGEKVIIGNVKLVEQYIKLEKEVIDIVDKFSNDGKTSILILKNNILMGIISILDDIREDSIKAIECLKKLGLSVYMLTGDNEKVSNYIGKKVLVDHIYSSLLPDEKEKIINSLIKVNKVIMVGDGINDAIALKKSNIGMAIGEGSDIALDSSDIVLMKNTLMDCVKAIRLSKGIVRNIYQNYFYAFFYNALCIPIAAGVFIPLFNFKITPSICALAMSLSSFCVVCNALRLNFIDLNSVKYNYKFKIKKRGKLNMEKEFNVEGMMCPHCEMAVKTAIMKIDGVVLAKPSYKDKKVVVEISKDIADEVIINAIVNAGYKVV